MRKGNLSSPNVDVVQGSHSMPSPTAGMAAMGGLMGGSDAGVVVKQLEGVSVGSPKLTTPATKVDSGSKTPSSAGAKIGKANVSTPAVDLRKGY